MIHSPGEREKSKSGKLEIYRLPLLGFATLKYSLLGNPAPFFSGFFRRLFRYIHSLVLVLSHSDSQGLRQTGCPTCSQLHSFVSAWHAFRHVEKKGL